MKWRLMVGFALAMMLGVSMGEARAGLLPGTRVVGGVGVQFVIDIFEGQGTIELPNEVVAGDVVLLEPPGYQQISDVLRFSDDPSVPAQAGTLTRFVTLLSNAGEGEDTGLPDRLSDLTVYINEALGAFTIYDVGNVYIIHSQGIPEPASLTLLTVASACGGLVFWRRRRTA